MFLYRLAKSDIPYGYWVTPEGEAIPVWCEACHTDVLDEHGIRGYGSAFGMGWYRVVFAGECGIEGTKPCTEPQAIAISKVFKPTPCDRAYVESASLEIKRIPIKSIYSYLLSGGPSNPSEQHPPIRPAVPMPEGDPVLAGRRKTLYRLAVVIENNPGEKTYNYMDIGHSMWDSSRKSRNAIQGDEGTELLWVMRKDYSIETRPATDLSDEDYNENEDSQGNPLPNYIAHEEAFDLWGDCDETSTEERRLPVDQGCRPLYLAKGRFTKNPSHPNGVVSFVMNNQYGREVMEKNVRRYEYMKQKAIETLERQWGAGVEIVPL